MDHSEQHDDMAQEPTESASHQAASLSDWEQQHRRHEGQEEAESDHAHVHAERSRSEAERDMASLYAHAGLHTSGTDFNSALHAMTEHSQLLADFAMSAQEGDPGGAAREGFYEPGNPMHEAFSHQHQHEHANDDNIAAGEAERNAQAIAARMLQDVNARGDDPHGGLDTSGASTPRGKARSTSASAGPGPKSTRGRKLGDSSTPLTPAQKKLNHIVSEQRRRASIRRGYELLCAEVPALRMAPLVGGAQRGGSGPGGGGAVGGRKRERDALLGVKSPVVKRRRGRGGDAYALGTTHGDGTGAYSQSVGQALGMEVLLQAQQQQQQEQEAAGHLVVDPSTIGMDGRSGPRSENNVLNKSKEPYRVAYAEPDLMDPLPAIEYIRSLHSTRLDLLHRLQDLRTTALERFPPAQHEALLLRQQTVANIVVVEPRLPTLGEFIKQHNAKVAAGQSAGAKRKKGDMGDEADGAALEEAPPPEEEQAETAVVATVGAVDADDTSPTGTDTGPDGTVKTPDAQLQTVLVNWEDTWKGGQTIDDEEEADNAANAA